MPYETLCEMRMFAIEQASRTCGEGTDVETVLAAATAFLNFILGGVAESATVH